MLESWKDLYISYPFMPLAESPEWFKHVKDLRVVVVLPAANIIFKYKNVTHGETSYVEGNWYAIRAYLTSLNTTTMQAKISVYCEQLQEEPKEVTVNLYDWTAGVPSEQSYMLIDSDLETPYIPSTGYELQLDTLLFMQEAPHLTINETDCGHHINVTMGHNVNVSQVNNGILFYGGAGTGLGTCNEDASDVGAEVAARIPEDKQGFGITNINGMVNSVWIKGTFPISIKQEDIKDGNIKVVYTDI